MRSRTDRRDQRRLRVAGRSWFPCLLDGASQNGFTGQPIVEIKGSGGSFDGLILGPGSDGSTIVSLDIANFAAGVHVESPNASILGNFVGTDLTGQAAGPGNVVGILVDNASNVIVGGTTPADGNTIGFNSTASVQIFKPSSMTTGPTSSRATSSAPTPAEIPCPTARRAGFQRFE